MAELNIITETTCGEACWHAREEICRCSCAGRNHGIAKTGETPERMSKKGGFVYYLVAIGEYQDVYTKAFDYMGKFGLAGYSEDGYYYTWGTTDGGSPAKVTGATESEIKRWHEFEYWTSPKRPYLLWVRRISEEEKQKHIKMLNDCNEFRAKDGREPINNRPHH
jgi:hypothetical protein